jgi:hypothetical protein
MSGERICIDLISHRKPRQERRSKWENRQKRQGEQNVSYDHTNSRCDGRRRLL